MNATATNDNPTFEIVSGVAIPPRTIPNSAPRESKYPVDKLEEGQAFAVAVSSVKEARQKQSQFSGLAKTRGIKLVTRFYETDSPFANTPAPCLGVWHAGEAPKKDEKAATDDANADANTGEASDASDTAEAQADEEVVVL